MSVSNRPATITGGILMRALWLSAGLIVFVAVPLRADEAKKTELKSFEVPYRLSTTKHIVLRAKIDGKGPFNFIMDTGAPALFVGTKPSAKLGVKPGKDGWGTFEKFEIEGGVVLDKAKGRIEDPFQLEGMNGLGLAGVELHGVIGYNILARYRMEIDFTKDKMTWTEIPDFNPTPPKGLEGAKGAAGGLDAMGGAMKLLGGLMGKRPEPEIIVRGFLGAELSQGKGCMVVDRVQEKGPADKAGLKLGDRLLEFNGTKVNDLAGLLKTAREETAGKKVKLTVGRGEEVKEIVVTLGEGL
jgi:hypothetical protein